MTKAADRCRRRAASDSLAVSVGAMHATAGDVVQPPQATARKERALLDGTLHLAARARTRAGRLRSHRTASADAATPLRSPRVRQAARSTGLRADPAAPRRQRAPRGPA